MDQSKKSQTPPEPAKSAARESEAPKKAGKAKVGAEGKPDNPNDFPRMLHKGPDRMVVKNEDELKAALADGWDWHREPVVAEDDLDLAELPASTAVSRVAEMNDISALETLRNQEVGRPKVPEERANVLRAIDERIARLRKVNQPKTAPPPSSEPAPASGTGAIKAHIANLKDVAALKEIREAEMNNPGGPRTDVLNAIAARIEELAG